MTSEVNKFSDIIENILCNKCKKMVEKHGFDETYLCLKCLEDSEKLIKSYYGGDHEK